MSQSLILLGGGGHALSCYDIIAENSQFILKGYIADTLSTIFSTPSVILPYIGDDSCIPYLSSQDHKFLVAVGQIRSSSVRRNLFKLLVQNNSYVPAIKAKSASVSQTSFLDSGTICMGYSYLGPLTSIGKNCIINTRSTIEHGASIGNHCHISTGALINGECRIGDDVFIGSGAIIYNNVSIGKGAIISAGAIVKHDILPGLVYK